MLQEWLTRRYLQALDYQYVGSNLRYREVEIDLVMAKRNTMAIIEIKTAETLSSPIPSRWKKQIQKQKEFIQNGGLSLFSFPFLKHFPPYLRFDLVLWSEKKMHWYKNI